MNARVSHDMARHISRTLTTTTAQQLLQLQLQLQPELLSTTMLRSSRRQTNERGRVSLMKKLSEVTRHNLHKTHVSVVHTSTAAQF